VSKASKDVMLYWSPKTTDDALSRKKPFDHAASDQLWRTSPGDTIWAVTVRNGDLFLLGRLYVDDVTNRMGAIRKLGATNVWGDKKHYAIAPANQIEPVKEVSIANIADKLRFKTTSKERMKLNLRSGGKVNAQQLQTMRVLENTSVELLEQVWSKVTEL
jgi:hypothetical protein